MGRVEARSRWAEGALGVARATGGLLRAPAPGAASAHTALPGSWRRGRRRPGAPPGRSSAGGSPALSCRVGRGARGRSRRFARAGRADSHTHSSSSRHPGVSNSTFLPPPRYSARPGEAWARSTGRVKMVKAETHRASPVEHCTVAAFRKFSESDNGGLKRAGPASWTSNPQKKQMAASAAAAPAGARLRNGDGRRNICRPRLRRCNRRLSSWTI